MKGFRFFVFMLFIMFTASCSNLSQYFNFHEVNSRSSNGLLLPLQGKGMVLIFTNDEAIESEASINSQLVGNVSFSNVLYVNLKPGEYIVSTPLSDTFSQNISLGVGEIVALKMTKEKGSFYLKPVSTSNIENRVSNKHVVVSNY